MMICLECGHTFEDEDVMSWVERHGLAYGPYEHMTGCPVCGGAYTDAVCCDECGKWVLPDDLIAGHYCRDCLADSLENTFTALEYLESNGYLEQFIFENMLDSSVPSVTSHNLRVWLRDTFLRMDRDGQLRRDGTFRAALKYYVIDEDGECGRTQFAEWLYRYNRARALKAKVTA